MNQLPKSLQAKLKGLKQNKVAHSQADSFVRSYITKNRLFVFLTCISILISLIGITLGRVSQSYVNFQNRSETLIAYVEDLFKVSSNLEADLEVLITNEINSIAEPINSFWLTEWLTKYETSRALRLIKDWKEALNPLTEYEISSAGIVAGVSKPTFTNSLQEFFLVAPELIEKTRLHWRSLWPYRLSGLMSVQLRNIFDKVSRILDLLEYINANQQKLLFLLGHYSTQTIVLFNQNPGEARPTGGFTGSYIIMEISQGELSIKESQSIYFVSNVTPDRPIAHHHTWMYEIYKEFRALPHGLHNMNYFPCFRDSASLLASEFERSRNGFTINQLFMITPDIMQALLPPDFILEVPEVGTFNSDNLLDEIERLSSFEAVDITNPKKQIKNIFTSLIDSFEQIVEYFGPNNIVKILLNGFFSRHIQIWFPSPDLTDFVRRIGFSSDQVCSDVNPSIVTFLVSNMSGDKRQLITKNNFGISAKRNFGGYRVTLHYKQELEGEDSLQRGFNPYGLQFFGFQLPRGARNIEVESNPRMITNGLRKYYQIRSQINSNKQVRTPDIIEKTARSVSDLEDGLLYQNPDGSMVAGAYVNDRPGEAVLEVSFDIDKMAYETLTFYPQPGLNKPILRLGNNTASNDNIYTRKVEGLSLEQGVDIAFF